MKREQEIINKMHVEFPSHSCNESLARAVTAAFSVCLDPEMGELSDIKTAVSEAVTNAIVHGYPNSVGTIEMDLVASLPPQLEITVSDRGVGIPDINKAREPMFTTGGEERSGMGFTIMEHFMSELYVASEPGAGTTVTMRKRLISRGGEV